MRRVRKENGGEKKLIKFDCVEIYGATHLPASSESECRAPCRVQGVAQASPAESFLSIFCTNVSFALCTRSRSGSRIVSALNTHSNCQRAVDRERNGGRESGREK